MSIKWGPKDVVTAFQKELQYTPASGKSGGNNLLNVISGKAKGLLGTPGGQPGAEQMQGENTNQGG